MEKSVNLHTVLKKIPTLQNFYLATHPPVLRPKNLSQLKECLKVSAYVELNVQSQGKNWGYKNTDGKQVILDLSQFNKILEFNEQLAYISIQPGVTFDQVHNYLKKNKSSLMLSVTGGSPQASIIATVTERGIGKGTYADLYSYSCAYEVLLPNGKIIHTGFSSLKSPQAQHVHKWGTGPTLDGLFTQSNLGIVTKMTIWLKPKPKYFQLLTFTLKDDSKFAQLIDTIRLLKQNDIIKGNFLFANHFRYITSRFQYPWNEANFKTPLPEHLLKNLMKKSGLKGKWTAEYAIHNYNKLLGKAYLKTLVKHLKPIVSSIEFLDEEKIRSLKNINSFAEQIPKNINKTTASTISYYENSPYLGTPTSENLKSLYWRKRISIPAKIDPERDKCGIVWFNSAIPMEGEKVLNIVKTLEEIIPHYNFEPNIGFNFISERVIYLVGVILYDKSIKKEHEQALACVNEINKKLASKGYFPYRSSGKLSSFQRQEDRQFIEGLYSFFIK